jgi:hypothetical protein
MYGSHLDQNMVKQFVLQFHVVAIMAINHPQEELAKFGYRSWRKIERN